MRWGIKEKYCSPWHFLSIQHATGNWYLALLVVITIAGECEKRRRRVGKKVSTKFHINPTCYGRENCSLASVVTVFCCWKKSWSRRKRKVKMKQFSFTGCDNSNWKRRWGGEKISMVHPNVSTKFHANPTAGRTDIKHY